MTYDADHAARYEEDREHTLPAEEAEAWLAQMLATSQATSHRGRVLDVGAGTGMLTAVLHRAGYDVVGLEPARPMIDEALRRNAQLTAEVFMEGRSSDARLFVTQSFDWIVCRQVLCHIEDPDTAFRAWHGWLKPGGRLMLVDGFWRRSAWSESALQKQPFASITSAAPVAEMLAREGFEIARAGPFGELNLARADHWPDTTPRYVVVARRATR
ncbi:MAG: class I SAM-dependent methyltransferase [Neoaquamicrobium sediminum]|uniref:class I SAM-dependent methyltransferase n=1 Tax=Neoaquamicrobium sediminum TaxID=1849104 RepID=UPI0040372CA5